MALSNLETLRREIPLTGHCIYFDSSATSLTPSSVISTMNAYYSDYCMNIERGSYRLAQRAGIEYEAAKGSVSRHLFNCKAHEFIPTRNFTEAANLVAFSIEHPFFERGIDEGRCLSPLIKERKGRGLNIVSTSIEHHSNFMPWLRLAKDIGAEFRAVSPRDKGCLLSPDIFLEAVDDGTLLVAFQHISNSIGVIHPVEDIVGAVKKRNRDTLIFVDGAQAAGHMKIDFMEIGCDFYGFSGHKGPLGPKGTGGLVIKEELLNNFHPFFLGGGTVLDVSERDYKLKDDCRRLEGGTPYIPGMIGLGRAARLIAEELTFDVIEAQEKRLTERLMAGLGGIGGVEVYGPKGLSNRAGIVTFNIDGWLSHDVSLTLDEKWDILTRAGHHCAIPAMRFLNILDRYGGNVRVSLHAYNTEEEIDKFLDAVAELAAGR